jgi:hypothetical protein
MAELNLKIKMTSNNQVYEVKVSEDGSVLDLKKECADVTNVTEKEQNLVYKGRILADDKNLKDYNIQNDHTLILVKKFSETEKKEPTTSSTTTSTTTQNPNTSTSGTSGTSNQPLGGFGEGFGQGGFGQGGFGQGGFGQGGFGQGMPGMGGVDPSQLSAMMNNPMYMQMMNEMMSDPNTLNMIMNSPQLKPLLDSNPQLRTMMQNPQMMQSMLNPTNLQNALNMMGQGGMGGMGTNPYASKLNLINHNFRLR